MEEDIISTVKQRITAAKARLTELSDERASLIQEIPRLERALDALEGRGRNPRLFWNGDRLQELMRMAGTMTAHEIADHLGSTEKAVRVIAAKNRISVKMKRAA